VLTRHCETVGGDVAEVRKTVALFADPFTDVDGYLKTLDQYAELGIGMINIGPMPGTPDPASWVKRFGDELMPRLAEIG
jgi:pyruvate/oxaloacetate carboxyltransferase